MVDKASDTGVLPVMFVRLCRQRGRLACVVFAALTTMVATPAGGTRGGPNGGTQLRQDVKGPAALEPRLVSRHDARLECCSCRTSGIVESGRNDATSPDDSDDGLDVRAPAVERQSRTNGAIRGRSPQGRPGTAVD